MTPVLRAGLYRKDFWPAAGPGSTTMANQYDDQPNKVLPEDTKVVGFIPEEPRNVNSVLNLLYTNIDWKLNFKTIRGTEENPVHAWQKTTTPLICYPWRILPD